ncbi:NADH-quinone oxidoreductase subunit NuoG [Tepidamorphus sp. 3E244]|uniref:NADH-quinone oxidoreductase subunit NuoG n=1 Tax=Tepidamorphus sp. 3E244 TaxID=3385498 RepID=UPI0038FD1814
MAKLIVDGTEIEVPAELTLLQACEEAGAEIPRFCYHERLSIAGNCRMCLVEVKGAPKPVASCAQSVRDLRPGPNGEPPEVLTKSALVRKAREGVMEFLLINHPLDCPICDQGGECDLQDQAMAYGVDTNRFDENKRAVEDKYIGPLVKTIMTRCIHCTRCVRFITEVAGCSDLGAIGRGEDMEITTYLETAMRSEMQGNVIDLCPVGALTSRPYAFQARPWELSKTESIDVADGLGSNIRVDARGREVMRIMPRVNDEVNEEWISDKTRFLWDGLKAQRLDKPYVRKSGKLQPASWQEAFAAITKKVKASDASKVGAIVGDMAACEEMFALKDMMDRLGSPNVDCRQDGSQFDPTLGRASYLFNATLAGLEDADAILMVGAWPRWDATVLNARIRKHWLATGVQIGLIGAENPDMTYPYAYLGAGADSLTELADGNGSFAKVLKKAKRPAIIVGPGAYGRADGASIMALVARVADAFGVINGDWNGFSVLHTAASRVGGLDLGLVPGKGGLDTAAMLKPGALDVLFLLGADEIETGALESTFKVYIGTHGDRGAHAADVILPAAAFSEKSGTYVNTEGRVQAGNRATFPPGDAREDWSILRALSDPLGVKLPYDSLPALRAAMAGAHPHLGETDMLLVADASGVSALTKAKGKPKAQGFARANNYYLTNPICRASKVMAELAAMAANTEGATGTNG